ncbi:MAG: hypothetical protein ABF990_13620 [Acetobacter sp.]
MASSDPQTAMQVPVMGVGWFGLPVMTGVRARHGRVPAGHKVF